MVVIDKPVCLLVMMQWQSNGKQFMVRMLALGTKKKQSANITAENGAAMKGGFMG